jgi:peptidoglycan/xylan/chitin deacetylase (PgdA/CDA1 family)
MAPHPSNGLAVHDRLLWCRRLVKTAAAKTLTRFMRADRVLVVGYHRVVERFDQEARSTLPGNLVSRAMFEQHVEWIGRTHDFVSADELGDCLTTGRRLRRPVAVLTFDDGYQDVYENAVPFLVRKGIPATFFIVSGLVGGCAQAHDRLYALIAAARGSWAHPATALRARLRAAGVHERPRWRPGLIPSGAVAMTRALLTSLPHAGVLQLIALLEAECGAGADHAGLRTLTWPMITDLHRRGMTIGSHTRTHVLLTNETRARVIEEVSGSRTELQRRLGASVVHFAYPDGRFNLRALRAVRTAGYRLAFTTCPHQDRSQPLLTIPRRMLWEHSAVDTAGRFSPELFQCQASGILLGRRVCTWQSHA